MLRITPSKSAAGAQRYYTEGLAKQDYLSEGQEVTGQWFGHGAEMLGLFGDVMPEAFTALTENRHPLTGKQLTARQKKNRRVGYDFTFSAPKGISLLYGMTGDHRIKAVFEKAVRDTLRDIEKDMRARVRKGGAFSDRVTGNIVSAGFTHYLARPVGGEPDPHLHSDNFIFNATWDPVEKEWKAGEFAGLHLDRPYYEACFETRLAMAMRELGYEIERNSKGWDLAGLSKALLDKFSRRTKEIEAEASRRGITDPDRKGELGAKTRNRKGGNLDMDRLRGIWRDRISSMEHRDMAEVLERSRENAGRILAGIPGKIYESLVYSIAKSFEKNSVVDSRKVMEEAMRYGVGHVSPENAEAYRKMEGVMTVEESERTLVTTREVLAEEKKMLGMARAGRGQCLPLGKRPHRPSRLNKGQAAAVRHVLSSWDRVMVIRGYAGTGKTTAIKEAAAEIEAQAGIKVFACAPSADASRGTQRQEGFSKAETLEYLLRNDKLHDKLRGGMIWVDEASMIGCRNMVRLFALAEKLDARVLLTGDSSQHGSVERGDAFRLLETHAGLESPVMTEIVRQRGEYAAAAKDFAERRPVEGFDKFEKMGWVVEAPNEVRPLLITQDYLWEVNAKKRALIVAPTHAEGRKVTACIRDLLKKDGKLGEEREVLTLRNLHWTEAEKADASMYETGQIVQFMQNMPGVLKGDRFTVIRTDKGVWFRNAPGKDLVLPLNYTDRFQVYRAETMPLAVHDLVRTTAGGKALEGTIDNGCVARVTGFTGKGDIRLSNGKILPKDFGHLAPGYYITSWSGQSKTVDKVLIAEGEESFRAANLEQFYVSCTRGRESCRIYTDDKDSLRERIVHSSQRGSAMELLAGQVAANTRPRDVTERAMKDRDRLRKRVAYRRKHEAVAEAIRDRIAVGEGRRRGEWYERLVSRQERGPDYGR
jgi:conjugative relaxase-like TrwC/TraI family protein